MPQTEIKKALIVVRTYPTPARKGAEVSCTAAITDTGEWLRLYPVPWRYLPEDQRFRKYEWVELTVTKSTNDSRPESHKLKPDGIKILSHLEPGKDWQPRKDIILPLKAHCLCCLTRQRDAQGFPTLGIIKPKKIERLIIEPDSPSWTQGQLEILRQSHLFVEQPKKELEKVPFKFQYKFWCDDADCTSHTLSCTDWEIGEAWRRWSSEYGSNWESKFRQRFEEEMIEKYDTHFYVGTLHKHPARWIIVGLFYPPIVAQGEFTFSLQPAERA
jgi:hypothetical protein